MTDLAIARPRAAGGHRKRIGKLLAGGLTSLAVAITNIGVGVITNRILQGRHGAEVPRLGNRDHGGRSGRHHAADRDRAYDRGWTHHRHRIARHDLADERHLPGGRDNHRHGGGGDHGGRQL